jgi:hypothetical protein
MRLLQRDCLSLNLMKLLLAGADVSFFLYQLQHLTDGFLAHMFSATVSMVQFSNGSLPPLRCSTALLVNAPFFAFPFRVFQSVLFFSLIRLSKFCFVLDSGAMGHAWGDFQ